jgi:hypothetical protein
MHASFVWTAFLVIFPGAPKILSGAEEGQSVCIEFQVEQSELWGSISDLFTAAKGKAISIGGETFPRVAPEKFHLASTEKMKVSGEFTAADAAELGDRIDSFDLADQHVMVHFGGRMEIKHAVQMARLLNYKKIAWNVRGFPNQEKSAFVQIVSIAHATNSGDAASPKSKRGHKPSPAPRNRR